MINFILDPFDLILEAAKEIKPDIDFCAVIDPSIRYKRFLWFKFGACGYTTFPDDGSLPIIHISSNIPYEAMAETYAHEISHVIAGINNKHDKVWNDTFDRLYKIYNDLIDKTMADWG